MRTSRSAPTNVEREGLSGSPNFFTPVRRGLLYARTPETSTHHRRREHVARGVRPSIERDTRLARPRVEARAPRYATGGRRRALVAGPRVERRGCRARPSRTSCRRVRRAREPPLRLGVPVALARGGERQARRGGHRRRPVLRLHADPPVRRVSAVLANGQWSALPGPALRRGRARERGKRVVATGTRTPSTCLTSCRRATSPKVVISTAKTKTRVPFCGSSPGTGRSSPRWTKPSRGCASAASGDSSCAPTRFRIRAY